MLVYSGTGIATGLKFDEDGFVYPFDGHDFVISSGQWSYDYADICFDFNWQEGTCSIFYDGTQIAAANFTAGGGLSRIEFQTTADDYFIVDKISITDQEGDNTALITTPCACKDDLLRGRVAVTGSAWCENFGMYEILFCPADLDPYQAYNWNVADTGFGVIENSTLGYWDTTAIPNGYYYLALAIYDDHLSCPNGVQIVTANMDGYEYFKRFAVVGDFKSNSFVHEEKPDLQAEWFGQVPFELTRVYNSARRFYQKPFANGFSHSYQITLTEDSRFYYTTEFSGVFEIPSWDGNLLGFGDVWITFANGHSQLFRRTDGYSSSATTVYQPWPDSTDGEVLERTSLDDGTGVISRIEYLLKQRDGTEYFFNIDNAEINAFGPYGEVGFCVSAGITWAGDRFGNAIAFTWDAQKAAITSMTNSNATIEFDLADGFYTQARLVSDEQTILTVNYIWDDDACAFKVIKSGRGADANGLYDEGRILQQVTKYQYDANGFIRKIAYDENISTPAIEIDYDEFGRVKARKDNVEAGLGLETNYAYKFYHPLLSNVAAWWLETTESTKYRDQITIQDQCGATVETKTVTKDGAQAIDSNCSFNDTRHKQRPSEVTESFDGSKRKTELTYNSFGDTIEKKTYVTATDHILEQMVYHPDYCEQIRKTGFTELNGRGGRVETEYIYGNESGVANEHGKFLIEERKLASGEPNEPNAVWASTRYEYFANGLLKKKMDPNNFTTLYEYDLHGNKTFEKVLQGSQIEITKRYYYDGLGRLCLEASPAGLVTMYRLDDFGNCYKTVLYSDPQCMGRTDTEFTPDLYQSLEPLGFTQSGFDLRGNNTFEKLISGGCIRTTYTLNNLPKHKLYDDGGKIEYTYDDRGLKICQRDINRDGNDWSVRYAYDSLSRLTASNYYDYDDTSLLKSTRSTYTASGQAAGTSIAGLIGAEYESLDSYDILGRRVQNVVAPSTLAITTTYVYDAQGNCVEETDPNGTLTYFDYDLAGRKIAERFRQLDKSSVASVKTGYEYYLNGTQKAIVSYDRDGTMLARKEYEYDARGRVQRASQKIDSGLDVVTSYKYCDSGFDHLGELYNIRIIDGAGKETYVRRDALGNWVKVLYPSQGAKLVQYNADGTIASRAVFDSTGDTQWITYNYDGYGRLTRTNYPDGGYVENEYDSFGRRLSTTDRRNASENIGHTSQITFSYDPLGRMIATTDHRGFATLYSYSANDSVCEITVCSAGTSDPIYDIAYFYDGAGSLIQALNLKTFVSVAEFTRDKNSRLTRTRFNLSNTWLDGSSMYVNCTYDRDDNLIGTNVWPADVEYNSTYDYDALGRLRHTYETCGSTGNFKNSYEYDMLSRLTRYRCDETSAGAFEEHTYIWDNAGNLVSKTAVTEAGTQNVGFTYNGDELAADSLGNMQSWDRNLHAVSSLTPEQQESQFAIDYTWDGFIKICLHSGSYQSVRYIPDGPRISKTVTGPASAGYQYIYDMSRSPAKPLLVLDGDSGSVIRSYIWADDKLIVQYNGAVDGAEPLFVLTDRLSSVRALVNTNYQIVSNFRYDPWGNPTGPPPQIDCDIRFGGYFYDSDIKKYYCDARYYDPQTLYFTTADPAKADFLEPPSFHPFLYCLDDPVNRTDPEGLFGGIIASADIRAREAKRSVGALNWARRYITEINKRHFATTLRAMRENVGMYSRSNYRNKLFVKLGGKAKGDVHHIIPQEFREVANKALREYGLSIDHPWFTTLMKESSHITLHRAGYNAAWRAFFENSHTALEIVSNAISMGGL